LIRFNSKWICIRNTANTMVMASILCRKRINFLLNLLSIDVQSRFGALPRS
jgi:hypothetical protein